MEVSNMMVNEMCIHRGDTLKMQYLVIFICLFMCKLFYIASSLFLVIIFT